ncbi:MAG: hypothetical protein KDB14_06205 [Planctomycetales bacterium]|nr:hypothetical protein [Planctomycetales bacterium]
MPKRFSISQLQLWILAAAVLAAILVALPCSPLAGAGAAIFVAMFGTADLLLLSISSQSKGLAISYTAFSLSVSLVVAFLLCFLMPPSFAPTASNLLDALGHTLTFVLGYWLFFCLLTLASFTAAICSWNQSKIAKWLVLANTPGIFLAGWLVAVVIYESS